MNKDELLKQYKRRLISLKEYEKLTGEHLDNEYTLHDMLRHKVITEFREFRKNLLDKSKEEIFDSNYEITCKEEIKDTLCYSDLDYREIEALLEEDELLTSFYQDWLDTDATLGESMEYCIDESIADVTKYYYRNKEKQNKLKMQNTSNDYSKLLKNSKDKENKER